MSFYIRNIKRTKTFNTLIKRTTQLDYYTKHRADPDIIKFVEMNNKTFGESMQKLMCEILKLDPPINTSHDARIIKKGLKFEIKSSRYWMKKEDFVWQHIMENHNYDYLILLGLDFHEISVYMITKEKMINLKNEGIIKMQGGAEGQGLWFSRNSVKQYLNQISNIHQFNEYINNEI
jgi:hypothetical protein